MKKNGFVFQTLPVEAIFQWTTVKWACLLMLASMATQASAFEDSPQAKVDQLKSQLDSLNGQLVDLEAKINTGQGDLQSFQNQYQDVLDELNQTIETLKESGLQAIQADPTNQKNIQTVMGILLNDANNGNDREVLLACDRLIAAGIHPAYFEYAAKAGRIKIGAREIFDEALIRQREFKSDDLPRVLLKTNKGDITVELYENEAPQTVANFLTLVESGFYDGCLFHSVIEGFRAQTGGPTQKDANRKDPGYSIYCECYQPDARPHFTDVLSMAVKSDRDTGASQFILTLDRTSELDGKHTVFGRIIDGHEITDRLVRTAVEINNEATDIPNANPDHIVSAEVIRKRDHQYTVRKVGQPESEKEKPVAPPVQPTTRSFDSSEGGEGGEDSETDQSGESGDGDDANKEDPQP